MLTKKASNKNNDHNAFGDFEDFGFNGSPQSTFGSQTGTTVVQPPQQQFFEQPQQPRGQSFEEYRSILCSIFSNPAPKSTSNTDFGIPNTVQNPERQQPKPVNQVDLLDLL